MISLDEVMQLHNKSIKDFGGSYGARDVNLLESAVAKPFHSFSDTLFYTTAFEKAVVIIKSIVKNHPFIDGNKRTEFLAGYVLLYRDNTKIIANQEEAYQFVIDVAFYNIAFEDIIT